MLPYKKSLVNASQKLRREMTPQEKHLWYDFLKKLPVPVKRQKNFESYILDFYIAEYKIAIEVDGAQHLMEESVIYDKKREEALNRWGIKVLRYTNEDINKRFKAVCMDILEHLGLQYSDMIPKEK